MTTTTYPGSLLFDSHFCKMAIDGLYLDSASLERIQNIAIGKAAKMEAKADARRLSLDRLCGVHFYRANIQLAGDVKDRYVVRIMRKDEPLWCDIITGSLYRQSGECMTSSNLYLMGEPIICNKREVKKFIASRKSVNESDE